MDRRLASIGIVTLALAALLGAGAFAARAPATAPGSDPASSGPAPATLAAAAVPGVLAQKSAADARRPFTVRRVLPIEGPIKYGEWHWDERGVPPGPIVITVDLQARVLSIFRGGYEIGAAAVMLGTDEHPTPVGTFPILSKERHNVSEQYGNAPMPFTLRLTWDGVAIHGGHEVENGYASHGCVAVPDALAERMFAVASKGDRVIITDGKRLEKPADPA